MGCDARRSGRLPGHCRTLAGILCLLINVDALIIVWKAIFLKCFPCSGEGKPAKKSEASSAAPKQQATKKEEDGAGEAPKPAASDKREEAKQKPAEVAEDSEPVQSGKIPKDEVALKEEHSDTDAAVGNTTPAAEEGASSGSVKEESSTPASPSKQHENSTNSPRKAGALASESEASQSESETNGDHAPRTAGGKTAAKKKAGGSGGGGSSKKKKKRNK